MNNCGIFYCIVIGWTAKFYQPMVDISEQPWNILLYCNWLNREFPSTNRLRAIEKPVRDTHKNGIGGGGEQLESGVNVVRGRRAFEQGYFDMRSISKTLVGCFNVCVPDVALLALSVSPRSSWGHSWSLFLLVAAPLMSVFAVLGASKTLIACTPGEEPDLKAMHRYGVHSSSWSHDLPVYTRDLSRLYPWSVPLALLLHSFLCGSGLGRNLGVHTWALDHQQQQQQQLQQWQQQR